MWKIELHWINGEGFFNKTWCDFAKEGKLQEGDICVFQKTTTTNKFEVAVFEKKNVTKFNTSGNIEYSNKNGDFKFLRFIFFLPQ